jgi:hypothetical protein
MSQPRELRVVVDLRATESACAPDLHREGKIAVDRHRLGGALEMACESGHLAILSDAPGKTRRRAAIGLPYL